MLTHGEVLEFPFPEYRASYRWWEAGAALVLFAGVAGILGPAAGLEGLSLAVVALLFPGSVTPADGYAVVVLPALVVLLAIVYPFVFQRLRQMLEPLTLVVKPEGLGIQYTSLFARGRRERFVRWDKISRVRVFPTAVTRESGRELAIRTRVSRKLLIPAGIANDERFLSVLRRNVRSELLPSRLEERLARPSRLRLASRIFLFIGAGSCALAIGALLIMALAVGMRGVWVLSADFLAGPCVSACLVLSAWYAFKLRPSVFNRIARILLPVQIVFLFFCLHVWLALCSGIPFVPSPLFIRLTGGLAIELVATVLLAITCALLAGCAVNDLFAKRPRLADIISVVVMVAVLAGAVALHISLEETMSADELGSGYFLAEGGGTVWTGDGRFFAALREEGEEDKPYVIEGHQEIERHVFEWHQADGAVTYSHDFPGEAALWGVVGNEAIVQLYSKSSRFGPASYDNELHLIDLHGNIRTVQFEAVPRPAGVGSISPDGKRVLVSLGQEETRVAVLALATGKLQILPLPDGVDAAFALGWTVAGLPMASSLFEPDKDIPIRRVEKRRRRTIWRWDSLEAPPVEVFVDEGAFWDSSRLDPHCELLFFVRLGNDDAFIVDLTKKLPKPVQIEGLEGKIHYQRQRSWSPDASRLYVSSEKGLFEVDTATAQAVWVCSVGEQTLSTGVMHGDWLLLERKEKFDYYLCWYSLKTGEVIHVGGEPAAYALGVFLSPDGKTVLFTSEEPYTREWIPRLMSIEVPPQPTGSP